MSDPTAPATVSVVVPTHGRPDEVRAAVGSILAQDHPGPIEVLVIHDGEEPVTPAFDVPEGRTVRALVNDRTRGLAGARNTGILTASGEWIAHCDDDDEWLPDKLRRQFEALALHPNARVVATGTRIVAGDKEIDRVWPREEVTFEDLLRSRVQEVHPSSLMAARGVYLDLGEAGLVDEELPGSYGEDYEWLLRAARRAPILVVRRPLVLVAWRGASLFADRWTTIAAALRYLRAKVPELATDRRGDARICGQIAFAEAARGDRGQAWTWARKAIGLYPGERRAYLALLVAAGLATPAALLRLANRMGRGI